MVLKKVEQVELVCRKSIYTVGAAVSSRQKQCRTSSDGITSENPSNLQPRSSVQKVCVKVVNYSQCYQVDMKI